MCKNNTMYLFPNTSMADWSHVFSQCWTHSVFAVWQMVSIQGTGCRRSFSTAPFIFHEFVIKSSKDLLDWDMTKFPSFFLPASFWMLACAKSSVSVLTFLDTIKSETSRLLSLLTLGGFALFAGAFVLSTLLPVGVYAFFCFRRAYLL